MGLFNRSNVKSPDTYDPAEFDDHDDHEIPPPPPQEEFVDTPFDDDNINDIDHDQNTLPYPEANNNNINNNNLQQQQQGSYANLTGAFRGQEKAQTFDEEEAGMDEIEVPSSSVVDRWNTWEEKYALKKRCRMIFIVGLGAVLVILAVTLGSVFGIRGSNKGGGEINPNEADGTNGGTVGTDKDTTTPPGDVTDTITDTGNNDQEDLTGIPDHMNTVAGKTLWDNDQLPATTKADFENPDSAASKAYTWLETDTKMASMEEGEERDLYVNQRFAAATLYNSFVDDNGQPMIEGWMTDDDVCKWTGIICYGDDARVRVRKLQEGDQDTTLDTDTDTVTTPTVPTDPLLRSKIAILDLSNSGIQGPIAPEIALLKDLSRIQMFDNFITGPIPEELYSLTKLEVIDLYNNQLSGTISPSIGNLVDLIAIYLGKNQFEGDIPVEIYSITNLFSLWIDDLVGLNGNPLPAEVGQLVNLNELLITKSNFNGQLPAEINNLVELRKLVLSQNAFTGAIPEITDLAKLETLDLSENFFSGVLPKLRNHFSLMHLRLNGNGLQGFIPNHYGKLEALVELRLNRNADDDIEGSGLTSVIPESLGSLENLKHLALQFNKLTGEIPEDLENLENLIQFTVNSNDLSGDVPDGMCEIQVLETMEADCYIGCDCCNEEEACDRD
jgi:Leucine-rich repeat (LRR) protein